MDKGKGRAFFKKKKIPLYKKAGELLNLSRTQLRILTGLLTAHCYMKGHLFKLGLVNSLSVANASRHLKQPHTFFVSASLWPHKDSGTCVIILWDQVTLRTSLSARFVQDVGPLNEWAEGPRKTLITAKVHGSLSAHPFTFCCSNQIVVVCKEWQYCHSRHFILVMNNHCFYRYPAIFVWKWENR